jgi:Carboxypeptidase regulatory-like domain
MRRATSARPAIVFGLMLLPWPARAQTVSTGAIAGEARDATGAVLPGVTVEAASPALIEKVRTVVTDGQGRYQIVELRPGTYTVTFTLAGFSAVKREGVELTAGFTAPVNAELRVGSITETITVSTASPVIDIQNVGT